MNENIYVYAVQNISIYLANNAYADSYHYNPLLVRVSRLDNVFYACKVYCTQKINTFL